MSALREFGQRVKKAQDDALGKLDFREQARQRLLAEAPVRRVHFARRPVAIGLVAAAAVAACVAWLVISRPLTFQVGATAGRVEEWIAAPVAEDVALRFSDGTEVNLEARTRARVAEVTSRGAKIVLERGRARLRVTPHRHGRWQVDVGPFAVRVTGTKFDVGWESTAERFTLLVHEGSVSVSGPVIGADRPVVRGQRLEVSLPHARAEISAAASAEGQGQRLASAPPAPAPSPQIEPPPASVSAPSTVRPSAPVWADFARAGKYKQALAAAEQEGFEALCAKSAPGELLELADAARLAGATARAIEAYQAVRRRFAGGSAAALAAFSLGRIDFDQRGAYAQAAGWFTTFLQEQPNGPLSREAAGRLIEARRRSGDQAGAIEAARQYLNRYPNGPHAELSRRLLDQKLDHETADGAGGK